MVRYLLLLLLLLAAGCASQEPVTKKKAVISFSGGNGESHDSAIVITGVLKPSEGVEAEYRYLSQLHGIKDRNWRIEGQTMYQDENMVFDVIEIELVPSSEKRIYYFDVTRFPWKQKEGK
jgi:hypothetical protein